MRSRNPSWSPRGNGFSAWESQESFVEREGHQSWHFCMENKSLWALSKHGTREIRNDPENSESRRNEQTANN